MRRRVISVDEAKKAAGNASAVVVMPRGFRYVVESLPSSPLETRKDVARRVIIEKWGES